MKFVHQTPDKKYAFTVKILRNPRDATWQDYDPFFDHIKKWVTIIQLVPEVKNDILHYHGVISVSPLLWRKQLRLWNFSLKLKRVYDMQGWNNYILKDILKNDVTSDVPRCNLFKRAFPEQFKSKHIVDGKTK